MKKKIIEHQLEIQPQQQSTQSINQAKTSFLRQKAKDYPPLNNNKNRNIEMHLQSSKKIFNNEGRSRKQQIQRHKDKYLPVNDDQQSNPNKNQWNNFKHVDVNSQQQDDNQYYFIQGQVQSSSNQKRRALTQRSSKESKNHFQDNFNKKFNSKNLNSNKNTYIPMHMMMRLQVQPQKQNIQPNYNQFQKRELIDIKKIQLKKQKVKAGELKILAYRKKLEQIYQNYKAKEQIKLQLESKIKKREAEFILIQQNNQLLHSQIQKLKETIKKSLLQREKQKITGSSTISKAFNRPNKPAKFTKLSQADTNRSNREKSLNKLNN